MCCSHIMMENCAYHLVAAPLEVKGLVETMVETVIHTGGNIHHPDGLQIGVGSMDIKLCIREDGIDEMIQGSLEERPDTRD